LFQGIFHRFAHIDHGDALAAEQFSQLLGGDALGAVVCVLAVAADQAPPPPRNASICGSIHSNLRGGNERD
jgi:hypothetical protein